MLANRKHAIDGQRALVQAQGLPNARAEPDAVTPREFVQRLRTQFPMFGEQGPRGGFMQQDAGPARPEDPPNNLEISQTRHLDSSN